jgi:DNA-binding IclR family transcriptional regulator
MTDPHTGAGETPRRRRPVGEPVGAYQAMRTVHALERLAFRPLSAPELAAALRIHHRTARRLLRRLQAEDYAALVPGPRRRYHLTRRLAALGRQAIAHDELPVLAAPWVATFAATVGRHAQLWIPCYADVVCILDADPLGPVPTPMLGQLAPAHASAPGKALLAHRQPWRDSLLAGQLQRLTERTLTDPRDLAAELERVRARGHAADTGEHDPDTRAVAAPVLLADEAIAALAVTLTADQPTTLDLDALAVHTARAAAALTRSLGHHP